MEGHRIGAVTRAHPQVVGRDRAELRNLQHRRDAVGDVVQCLPRRNRMPAGEQVFGLNLRTAARGEVEPKMRQPLVPRPGLSELGRCVCGRHSPDGVTRRAGQGRFEPGVFGGRRVAGLARRLRHTWVKPPAPKSLNALTL